MNIKKVLIDCVVLKKLNIYNQYLSSFKKFCIRDAINKMQRNSLTLKRSKNELEK